MKALISLAFEDRLVRIHDRDGNLWFVAKDVCAVLGLKNHKDAVAKLDADERDGVGLTDPIGREQLTTIISEPGFYRLCGSSRKPEAKRFIRWVFHEVLPEIRRTGSYGAPTGPAALHERFLLPRPMPPLLTRSRANRIRHWRALHDQAVATLMHLGDQFDGVFTGEMIDHDDDMED